MIDFDFRSRFTLSENGVPRTLCRSFTLVHVLFLIASLKFAKERKRRREEERFLFSEVVVDPERREGGAGFCRLHLHLLLVRRFLSREALELEADLSFVFGGD